MIYFIPRHIFPCKGGGGVRNIASLQIVNVLYLTVQASVVVLLPSSGVTFSMRSVRLPLIPSMMETYEPNEIVP